MPRTIARRRDYPTAVCWWSARRRPACSSPQEIHASGRPVTLAVGDHTRAPRRYRGDDIFARMELAGILDEPPHMGANLEQVRRQPSLQLIGRPDHSELNLEVLSRGGVQLAGRLADMDGTRVILGDNLARSAGASHARMVRMLDRIDQAIAAQGLDAPASDPDARAPFLPGRDALTLDLHRAGIRTVMWAAGYARRYPWLKLPVLDDRGEIVQRGGVTGAPGVYHDGAGVHASAALAVHRRLRARRRRPRPDDRGASRPRRAAGRVTGNAFRSTFSPVLRGS